MRRRWTTVVSTPAIARAWSESPSIGSVADDVGSLTGTSGIEQMGHVPGSFACTDGCIEHV